MRLVVGYVINFVT